MTMTIGEFVIAQAIRQNGRHRHRPINGMIFYLQQQTIKNKPEIALGPFALSHRQFVVDKLGWRFPGTGKAAAKRP